MKIILLLFLFIFGVNASAPTQNQDAVAAYLSAKIYDGVDTLDNDYGCIIKSRHTVLEGAYAIWKHYRTKECYVVIRGTNLCEINTDLLTDLKIVEVYDDEIEVNVHSGAKLRGDSILANIGDKLKECKRDIIITGHSLGGSVSHYMFLKYVKRYYYDWKLKEKASRFKAVMFAAPQLLTRSNNQLLVNYENNINWYKYGSDFGPELIRTLKGANHIVTILLLFWGQINITQTALDLIQGISYGDYIPGNRYHLLSNGVREGYEYIPLSNLNIWEHMNTQLYCDAIIKNGWGVENTSYDDNDPVSCLKMDYASFLIDEESRKIEDKEYSLMADGDGKIDIDTANCIEVTDYDTTAKYQNFVFYTQNINNKPSYIIKRLLDNDKEYEYAICNDNGFILKQCDSKCNCHEVIKNDRPKKINQCSSYQMDSTKRCMVDGIYKKIEYNVYLSLVSQTKIGDYYMSDYFCNNQTHQRGNFNNNSQKLSISFILLLLLLIFL